MAFNRYFPFNTEEAKTLEKLLAEAGAPADLVAAVADLETRVAAIESELAG